MNNKKILIAVLSLILLFTVSCDNENKTGGGNGGSSGGGSSSGSGKGDAIFSSIPDTTGSPTSDFSGTTTYTGTLNFDATGFDFRGDYSESDVTRDDIFTAEQQKQQKLEFTLTIKDNKITLEDKITPPEELFKDKILFKSEIGEKYNARAEKNMPEENGNTEKRVYYIEFYKSTDSGKDTLTSVKLIKASSEKGSTENKDHQIVNYDWGIKTTHTGDFQGN